MMVWGDDAAGECVHGERAQTCAACRGTEREAVVQVVVPMLAAVLTVAGLLTLGARAVRIEDAAEREALRRHLQRLEQHQPGALQRLEELAARQRGGRP